MADTLEASVIEGYIAPQTSEAAEIVMQRAQVIADETGEPTHDVNPLTGEIRGTAWPRSNGARLSMSSLGAQYEQIFGHGNWKGEEELNA